MDLANNSQVFEKVKGELLHYVGGPEKCQWFNAEIEGNDMIKKLLEPFTDR